MDLVPCSMAFPVSFRDSRSGHQRGIRSTSRHDLSALKDSARCFKPRIGENDTSVTVSIDSIELDDSISRCNLATRFAGSANRSREEKTHIRCIGSKPFASFRPGS